MFQRQHAEHRGAACRADGHGIAGRERLRNLDQPVALDPCLLGVAAVVGLAQLQAVGDHTIADGKAGMGRRLCHRLLLGNVCPGWGGWGRSPGAAGRGAPVSVRQTLRAAVKQCMKIRHTLPSEPRVECQLRLLPMALSLGALGPTCLRDVDEAAACIAAHADHQPALGHQRLHAACQR